jgi:hypothetical protein
VKFVQLIEMRTETVDEIQKLETESEEATEGKRTLRKAIVGRVRNGQLQPARDPSDRREAVRLARRAAAVH